jgi:hypothetical protein
VEHLIDEGMRIDDVDLLALENATELLEPFGGRAIGRGEGLGLRVA